MGPLLTHPAVLSWQDCHAAETCLGTRGHLGACSALNFTLWGCSFQFSPPGLSPPAPWGALCDTGWFFPPSLSWCQRGEVSADSPELVFGGACDPIAAQSLGLGWMGESVRWHLKGSRPTATQDQDDCEPRGHVRGLSWGIPPHHHSACANSGFAQAWPLWGRCH